MQNISICTTPIEKKIHWSKQRLIILGFARSKNSSSFNVNRNRRYAYVVTRKEAESVSVRASRYYCHVPLQRRNERENGKYRGIGYEEDKERESEDARESRDIVLRYFVMRSLFAGVKKSRSTTLATYIGHNDAVRLTLARAIGKRAEQWPIKTPLRVSAITGTCTCKSRKRERRRRARQDAVTKETRFPAAITFRMRCFEETGHVYFHGKIWAFWSVNWESPSLNSPEENVVTSIYALHCVTLRCLARQKVSTAHR